MEDVLVAPALVPIRATPAQPRGHAWPATSVSACLHLAALIAVCWVVVPRHLPPVPPQPSFAVLLAPPPPPPATEQMLQQAQLPPTTATVADPLATPRQMTLPVQQQAELHIVHRPPHIPATHQASQAEAANAPRPEPVTNAQAAPSPAAAPAPVPHDLLAGLEARIRQAVQEAAIYPASARVMHLEGRTQVRFDYTDGAVGLADVAVSSTSGMLDRAAVAAVRRAALPRAPAEIGTRTLPLLVWVDFRLIRQD